MLLCRIRRKRRLWTFQRRRFYFCEDSPRRGIFPGCQQPFPAAGNLPWVSAAVPRRGEFFPGYQRPFPAAGNSSLDASGHFPPRGILPWVPAAVSRRRESFPGCQRPFPAAGNDSIDGCSFFSESFTIFALIFVFKHIEVGLIATFSHKMVLQGLQHGATRLVRMRAVVETAVF